jgi:2-methylcitrate dehydratase PrpD
MSLLARLADFAVGAEFDTLDAEVARVGKLALIDTIGVTIAGATHPVVATIAAHAKATRGGGPLARALTLGAAAHVLDFDDSIYEGLAHPSACVLPALVALGGHDGIDGRDLIVSLVVGHETIAALGRVLGDGLYERGVWTTAALGIIGSAAASARALRLTPPQAAQAIALAACQAYGTREVMGTSAKPYLCGVAAATGLDSALAARAGLTAPATAIDGAAGFAALLNAGAIDAEALSGLGAALARPILGFKLFPVCSAAQAAAEALQSLMRTHDLVAADIARIDCTLTPFAARCLPFDDPRTPTQAQFSLNFALACIAVHGTITEAHLGAPNAALRAAMARVTRAIVPRVMPDGDGFLEAARVAVETQAGGRHTIELRSARCMPPNYPDAASIDAKFLANARASSGAGLPLLERLHGIDRVAGRLRLQDVWPTVGGAPELR